MEENSGVVRIAPNVLNTIVSIAALSVRGVSEINTSLTGGITKLIGRASPGKGVRVQVRDDAVYVDLYIVVEAGVNMLQVGNSIQESVSEAIETMVGMTVREGNVYIQDVR